MKRRLEDTKFVEESKEMIEGVRDAVKVGMSNVSVSLSSLGTDVVS